MQESEQAAAIPALALVKLPMQAQAQVPVPVSLRPTAAVLLRESVQ
ncbi:MAG: hypothetical protein J0M09_01695 [Xanthomonadales bacterium]|nr:hypothetical protein [Xanthomonadales bacterium]